MIPLSAGRGTSTVDIIICRLSDVGGQKEGGSASASAQASITGRLLLRGGCCAAAVGDAGRLCGAAVCGRALPADDGAPGAEVAVVDGPTDVPGAWSRGD
jgi:hypothetical protein